MNCMYVKFGVIWFKNEQMVVVFLPQKSRWQPCWMFWQLFVYICQSHNALHTPSKRAFQTLSVSWPSIWVNNVHIRHSFLEAQGFPKPCKILHVEKFSTGLPLQNFNSVQTCCCINNWLKKYIHTCRLYPCLLLTPWSKIRSEAKALNIV